MKKKQIVSFDNYHLLIIIIISCFIGILLFQSEAQADKKNIQFGFSMSLTGIYAPASIGQMEAYKLWEEDVNKSGGIFVKDLNKKLPVKLIYYDDKSSLETAVKVYEKLITQDKVDMLLSPVTTDIHFAIVPVAEKYHAPIVGSTASSIKIRDLNVKYFWFTTSSVPDRQMEALLNLMKSKKGEIKNSDS